MAELPISESIVTVDAAENRKVRIRTIPADIASGANQRSIDSNITDLKDRTTALLGLLLELGRDTGLKVNIVGADVSLNVEETTLDAIGVVDDAKETDPDAAEASLLALMRGVLDAAQAGAYAFDVPVAPTVTAGAYSAGDIMGGLLTFDVARAAAEPVTIDTVTVAFKVDVSPSLILVLFNADPSATTKTDNAAYDLDAADVFKLRAALPLYALDQVLVDHGTPNTIQVGNLDLVIKPASGTSIYGLLIDNTGVTLSSTSDLQVTLHGRGV